MNQDGSLTETFLLGNSEDITFWSSSEVLKESEGSSAIFDTINSFDIVDGFGDELPNRSNLNSLGNLIAVSYTSKLRSRSKTYIMYELS